MKKRFSTGKDDIHFTRPTKLTRQKRWTENPQEFVRLEQQAFSFYMNDKYIHKQELIEKDLKCLF